MLMKGVSPVRRVRPDSTFNATISHVFLLLHNPCSACQNLLRLPVTPPASQPHAHPPTHLFILSMQAMWLSTDDVPIIGEPHL